MKTFSICTAIAIFAALSHAAPFDKKARQYEAFITFVGAPEANHFHQEIHADGEEVEIDDPLSISQIYGDDGAICTFYGIDGSETIVDSSEPVDVGPPQTQVAGFCEEK